MWDAPAQGNIEQSVGMVVEARINTYIVDDDVVYYIIEIIDEDGDVYDLRKRYSELRDLHMTLQSNLDVPLPWFPPRALRLVNHLEPEFCHRRAYYLNIYVFHVVQTDYVRDEPALIEFFARVSNDI